MKTEDLELKIIKELISKPPTSNEALAKVIRQAAQKQKSAPPKKSDLLKAYHIFVKNGTVLANPRLESELMKRQVRTLSGVAPIAVLTKPYFCPGRCSFCPTEARMPKSYLSNEPAVMRAVLSHWDPYAQVTNRLESYRVNGHSTDKCEMIVIGGTWSFLPVRYQTWFIKRLFDGLNGFTSKSLKAAQKYNETAKNRMVGMCLETRPDYVDTAEVIRMRKLGCTRVEIGLQSTDPKILKLNKRGHGVETVRRATKLLRDAGFKISYHMMPNLPGATPESDIQSFKDLFNDPGLKPDMLKIYPCMVVKDAEIYDWWKSGKYTPYDDETLFKTLLEIKKQIPEYVRVTRLIRDIPTTSVYHGVKRANLRQDILAELKREGHPCRCIRCREPRDAVVTIDQTKLITREYETQGGTELFISYESKDDSTLYAFVRLRLPNATHPRLLKGMPELKNASIIRELHTYGALVPLDSTETKVQHKGFGKRLMAEAEREAAEHGYKKMAVISGIGVREYYKKIGYRIEGTYMVKRLA